MPIQFTSITTEEGQQFVTVLVNGSLQPPVDDSHPNFKAIVGACQASMNGQPVDVDAFTDLFDVGATIVRKFQRLSERVTIQGNQIQFDGDPVAGPLQDQILDFVDSGDDFGPLVNFYEKLKTNPLGDVQEGLFSWIAGQRADGALSITPEGDLLGYKSMHASAPEWRKDASTVYTPSRRGEGVVNGIDVPKNKYIEQVPGDVVEMPRSRVLNQPSSMCGDGLHIGTWAYAKDFSGDTVMLVRFSPRDIVSLPDSNSAWKLRVCRYTVIEPVTESLEVPLYGAVEDERCCEECDAPTWDCECGEDFDSENSADLTFDLTFEFVAGDRVVDDQGYEGTVLENDEGSEGDLLVDFDESGSEYIHQDEVVRVHGKGGPTSQAAKGHGLNPAQDPKTGQFAKGRPGSQRDTTTGRFAR